MFYPGDTIGEAVQALRPRFSAVSDLANAYVIRGDKKIAVDLAKFLHEINFRESLTLESNDVVVIPFRQFFISVSGAVSVPGRYPYIPDRKWDYYVGLAGGFDSDRNSLETIKIVDKEGNLKTKSDPIEPEDTITAKSNNALYVFGRVASILTTILTIVSLYFSIRAI